MECNVIYFRMVINMFLKFDEDEIANSIVKRLIEVQQTFNNADIDEESIIDDSLEAIDNWSADNALLSILYETVIEKLEEKGVEVVR